MVINNCLASHWKFPHANQMEREQTNLDQLTVSITEALIARASVSPEDAGCQKILADQLVSMGFSVEHLPFGNVSNLWAVSKGNTPAPILAFAGHIGDVIRVGRRGSLNATLTVNGLQGHVAYPDDAKNPVHLAMGALDELARMVWDQGNELFPPTSMQISNINAGTGASNIIPGKLEVMFNFRFSTEASEESLKHRTEAILDHHDLDYDLIWSLSGQPFITRDGDLIPATQESLRAVLGIETELSTGGGTSDGRFIAPTGTQVVELGPCNETIHKINECVEIESLQKLSRVYTRIIEKLLVLHR